MIYMNSIRLIYSMGTFFFLYVVGIRWGVNLFRLLVFIGKIVSFKAKFLVPFCYT